MSKNVTTKTKKHKAFPWKQVVPQCFILCLISLYFSFCFSFLNQCRPLSVSMGNAIKYVKWQIAHTPGSLMDSQVKH